VALGFVHDADGVDKEFLASGSFEIDLAGVRYAATPHLRSPYDPKAERVKADAAEVRAAA
jgi:4-methylaminobutanoate oxidase (formaldehyde-forming)